MNSPRNVELGSRRSGQEGVHSDAENPQEEDDIYVTPAESMGELDVNASTKGWMPTWSWGQAYPHSDPGTSLRRLSSAHHDENLGGTLDTGTVRASEESEENVELGRTERPLQEKADHGKDIGQSSGSDSGAGSNSAERETRAEADTSSGSHSDSRRSVSSYASTASEAGPSNESSARRSNSSSRGSLMAEVRAFHGIGLDLVQLGTAATTLTERIAKLHYNLSRQEDEKRAAKLDQPRNRRQSEGSHEDRGGGSRNWPEIERGQWRPLDGQSSSKPPQHSLPASKQQHHVPNRHEGKSSGPTRKTAAPESQHVGPPRPPPGVPPDPLPGPPRVLWPRGPPRRSGPPGPPPGPGPSSGSQAPPGPGPPGKPPGKPPGDSQLLPSDGASVEPECTESEAYRVLEEVVTMGRPVARDLLTGYYDYVTAFSNERLPSDTSKGPKSTTSKRSGGRGGDGQGGSAFGDPEGAVASLIEENTDVRLIFFRYHKGKVVRCHQPLTPFRQTLDNGQLAQAVQRNYASSKTRFSQLFTKIRFLYFIKVSYTRDDYQQKWIKATYSDVLLFEGNRTISRFIHLLRCSKKNDQSLTINLIWLRRSMDTYVCVPYIYVEIVEGLSTRAILTMGLISIMFSLVSGVAYAVPTQAWGDAFTLSGLLIASFALLLAVVAIYQYLGFEKLIDDEISARSGHYKYHPGHIGLDEINV